MTAIDKSQVWTGTLNEQALAGRPAPRARFYDTTLRDGEQSVGVMFDPEQKLEIAKLLDGIGVGRIEAGFPRVSEDDRIAIAQILKAGLSGRDLGLCPGAGRGRGRGRGPGPAAHRRSRRRSPT